MNGEIVRRTDGVGTALAPASPAGGLVNGTGSELHQRNVMQILWRGRWFIILCIIAAIGGGLFYLSKQTPIYASSSRILVEPDVKIIANDTTGSSRAGNYLQTQCELIKSAQILGPVAALPELGSMRTFAGVDNPIGLLKAGIDAQVGQKDDLITISFESPNAPESASVVNAVVDSYKAYQSGRKRSTAAEALRILTNEKRERDTELQAMTKKMLDFKQKNPNLSYTSERGNIIIEQLARLSDSLSTLRLAMLDARSTYEGAKATAQDPARKAYWIRSHEQNPANPLVAEVQRLEFELSTSAKGMLAEHATRKAMTARIEELHARIAEQANMAFDAYVAEAEDQWEHAKQREAELQKSFAEQQKLALSLNTQSTEFAMLESDAHRLEKFCDMLDSRIKEVQITEGGGPVNISVLEEARPGSVPVKPKRSTVLFQAMMLGLMAGCGLAYLRDWADQRLSSVDEVQSRLGLNVLGVLPHMPDRETASVRGQKVQLDPMSEMAEAYRTLRTAVFFGAPEDKAKTILVTSPTPGDGKTTTTSNLAIAMAQAGQRVLLVDCDFRKPTQHRIFGIEDGLGLSDVIAGRKTLNQVVKLTGTRGLYILPSGPIPGNPSEILHSEMFAKILAKLTEKFDHVVIDSPPVVPVADARILGAKCDLTILVLRAQKSTRRVSIQACESLKSVGARILGVVVNDVPRRRGGYGYYSYGYYHQGYGEKGTRKGLPAQSNGAEESPVSVASNGKH